MSFNDLLKHYGNEDYLESSTEESEMLEVEHSTDESINVSDDDSDQIALDLEDTEKLDEEIVAIEHLIETIKDVSNSNVKSSALTRMVDDKLSFLKKELGCEPKGLNTPSLESYVVSPEDYYINAVASLEGFKDILTSIKNKIKTTFVDNLRKWKGKNIDKRFPKIRESVLELKKLVEASDKETFEFTLPKFDMGPNTFIKAVQLDFKTNLEITDLIQNRANLAVNLYNSSLKAMKALGKNELLDMDGYHEQISSRVKEIKQLKDYDLINNHKFTYTKNAHKGHLDLTNKLAKIDAGDRNKETAKKSHVLKKSEMIKFLDSAIKHIPEIDKISSFGFTDIIEIEKLYKEFMKEFADNNSIATFMKGHSDRTDFIAGIVFTIEILGVLLKDSINLYMFTMTHTASLVESVVSKTKSQVK